MNLELLRDLSTPSETLGTLSVNGRKWHSIERPWQPIADAPCGKKGTSCVAPGTYRLEPHMSEQYRNVWALVSPSLWVYHWDADVPKPRRGLARTTVLIHVANWASELRGCIALGKTRAKDRGVWMVRNSADAVNELRMALAGAYDLTLTIEDIQHASNSAPATPGQ